MNPLVMKLISSKEIKTENLGCTLRFYYNDEWIGVHYRGTNKLFIDPTFNLNFILTEVRAANEIN